MSTRAESVITHTAAIAWRWGNKADIRAHEARFGEERVGMSCQEAFGGDPTKADPEQLFVAAVASCHMLWFLDFARRERLRVLSYEDEPEGEFVGDRFTRVVLRPRVELEAEVEPAVLERLHHNAHESCFIANSINCPVDVELGP